MQAGPTRDPASRALDERLVEAMLAAAHAATPVQLPAVLSRAAAELGLDSAVVYLADIQQRRLLPMLPDPNDDDLPELGIDDTPAGWVYRTLALRVEEAEAARDSSEGADGADGTERAEEAEGAGGTEEPAGRPAGAGGWGAGAGGEERLTVWLPLVDGAERLGVLGVRSTVLDAVLLRRARAIASVLAMVIASKRAHGDSLTRLTRSRPMELPAELLRAFLPPRTIGNADVVSAAVVEPAYEVGGDAFDHALAGGRLYASIFDSMGHNLASGMTTAVVVAGTRNARRNGVDLRDVPGIVDKTLAAWLPDQFCTAVLAEVDLASGRLRWCNCGHPPPLLIREHRVVPGALERVPQLPLGLCTQLSEEPRQVHEAQLRPGDRVLLHTDGVPDARTREGGLFGMDRFTGAVIRAARAGALAPEVLRLLVREILGDGDNQLRDDATIMLLEWNPPGAGRAVAADW